MGVGAYDAGCRTKRVFFRPATSSDTIRVGQGVCYNSDLAADHKERTTHPNTNHLGGDSATAYAEGVQSYTARLFVAEQPKTANLTHFAGIVKSLGPNNGADGDMIEIFELTAGAIVPVWTDANCVINSTVLGIADGAYTLSQDTGDGDPLGIGVAVETVDRSNTNGLVWMRMYAAPGIGSNSMWIAPSNDRNGRCYGLTVSGDNFFGGAAGAQEYLVSFSGDKNTAGTGDNYAAILQISGSNYAANDTNHTFRGLNCSVSNRSGGTMGHIYNTISLSLKSGSGNITNATALQIDAQDLTAGTKTSFGGLDVAMNREGTAATEEYGIRVRTRGTINTAMNTVFRIDKDATDHGFVNLFNIESDAVDYVAAQGDVTVTTSDKAIPIVLAGTTYYLIAVDGIPGV
jgi:hypothetical protein